MKIRLEKDTQVKVLCVGMILLLVGILIPLFWISTYNFKSMDDLSYAKNAELVWQESHSVLKVMGSQIKDTWEIYQEWQGTYFGLWFFTSMIGIFGESAYYMGTVFSLGGFVLAELFLLMVILVKGLGADKYRAAILSISCIAMQVLLTPYPVEAYFWFCGAVLYTFIHALALLLLTLLFLQIQNKNQKVSRSIILEIGILLLSIAVGGGNYVTGLFVLILYAVCVVWAFWKKNPCKIVMVCNVAVYLIAFLANMMAPGNAARQRASGLEHLSAIKSIFLSLKEGLNYCIVNLYPPCVILAIMLIPIMFHVVQKKNYKYPLPIVFSVITFGIFAAQFTPTIYALHIIGAGRVQNLYRFNFYILLYANEMYWIGWLWRRWRESRLEDSVVPETKEKNTSYLLPGWILGGMLLCVSLVPWGGRTVTTYSALQSLRTGEAQQYRQEYEERLVLLKDPQVKEVYLEPFSVVPYLLYFGDVVEDTEDWVNEAVAQYYDKDIVGLKSTEQ